MIKTTSDVYNDLFGELHGSPTIDKELKGGVSAVDKEKTGEPPTSDAMDSTAELIITGVDMLAQFLAKKIDPSADVSAPAKIKKGFEKPLKEILAKKSLALSPEMRLISLLAGFYGVSIVRVVREKKIKEKRTMKVVHNNSKPSTPSSKNDGKPKSSVNTGSLIAKAL